MRLGALACDPLVASMMAVWCNNAWLMDAEMCVYGCMHIYMYVCVRACEWIGMAGGNREGAVGLGVASAKQTGVSSGAKNRIAWWSVAIQEKPWHLSSVDGGHPQKRQASATLSCVRLLA